MEYSESVYVCCWFLEYFNKSIHVEEAKLKTRYMNFLNDEH